MFCELLQEKVNDEQCKQCWEATMDELAREYEANRLFVGKPRTITHEICRTENILRKE